MGLDDLRRKFAIKDALRAGTRVGQAEIDRLMAEGEWGMVYYGHQAVSKAPCAIRILRPELIQDKEIAERVLHELRMAQQINHPNVVRIVDVGEADGRLFVAMEFVKGEPLSALVRREGRLEVERATRILYDAALGLEAAHGVGLIHGQVQPGSMLIDLEGHLRVNGLGFSSVAARGPAHWRAPEQVEEREVDARCDQYALGLVYYHFLTGLLPFDGEGEEAIARSRLERDLPVVAGLPSQAQQLLVRLTARSARERFPGMREVSGACERLLQQCEREESASEALERSHPTWDLPKNVLPSESEVRREPKCAESAIVEHAHVTTGPRIAPAYMAYAIAVVLAIASVSLRSVAASTRMWVAGMAFLPLAWSAWVLLRTCRLWRATIVWGMGIAALGLLLVGLEQVQGWRGAVTPHNVVALGVVLLLSVVVSVRGEFRHVALRRMWLVVAFGFVGWGAQGSRGMMDWIREAPGAAMVMCAAVTFLACCGILLLPARAGGPWVRLFGFTSAAVGLAGVVFVASGGEVGAILREWPSRAWEQGTLAIVGLLLAVVAHFTLRGRG